MGTATGKQIFQALVCMLLSAMAVGAGDDAAIGKAGGKVSWLGSGVTVEFHLTA